MKRSSYEEFVTVKADSTSLFDKQLNEKVYELRNNYPEVKFSESIPLYAHIKYIEDVKIPESVSDEYELLGVGFTCSQCPYFKPIKKSNGGEDGRHKVGDCLYEGNEFGRSYRNQPACEHLYELIKEGGVKLCFME